jgi:hypothetical protein
VSGIQKLAPSLAAPRRERAVDGSGNDPSGVKSAAFQRETLNGVP